MTLTTVKAHRAIKIPRNRTARALLKTMKMIIGPTDAAEGLGKIINEVKPLKRDAVHKSTVKGMMTTAGRSAGPFHDIHIEPLLVPKNRADLKVGRRVRHQVFGDGAVIENPMIKPQPYEVAIEFDIHGTKVMMWDLCRSKLNVLPPLTRKQRSTLAAAKEKARIAEIKRAGGRK